MHSGAAASYIGCPFHFLLRNERLNQNKEWSYIAEITGLSIEEIVAIEKGDSQISEEAFMKLVDKPFFLPGFDYNIILNSGIVRRKRRVASELKEELKDIVKRIRKLTGFIQADLELNAGLTKGILTRVENDKGRFQQNDLDRFIHYFQRHVRIGLDDINEQALRDANTAWVTKAKTSTETLKEKLLRRFKVAAELLTDTELSTIVTDAEFKIASRQKH